MTTPSGIYSVMIYSLESRRILIHRIYSRDESVVNNLDTLYSTIVSFKGENEGKEDVSTFPMKTRKILITSAENLIFMIVVAPHYGTIEAEKILSHIRASFFRKYPLGDCNWHFDEHMNYLVGFKAVIDEIVEHFGDPKTIVKIVLMGIDYAGKTTLTHAYAGSNYRDYLPTMGLDILRIEYKNKHIRLWDLGGQMLFRSLWPKFANEASGIIFVVDSATTRWSETKEVFEISLLFKLPYIIFANKQDIVKRAQSINFIAERLQVPEEKIVKGSALLNKGIYEVLDGLLDEIG
ncbi:MAG: ADP-ribosylation factor-like protein [Candidatus Thorarchaeota archaeon]